MSEVYLNGKFIGNIENPEEFRIKVIEERRDNNLSQNINIMHDSSDNNLYIESGKGRIIRPLIIVKEGKPLLTSAGKPFTVSWKDKFNERWGSHYPTPEQLEIMKNLFDSGTAKAVVVYQLSTDPKSKIPRFPVLKDIRISADKHYESD